MGDTPTSARARRQAMPAGPIGGGTGVRVVLWLAGLILASGILFQITAVVLSMRPALVVDVAASGALLALWAVTRASPRLRAASPVLLVWAALLVFGWVSGLVMSLPQLTGFRHAPVPVLFLAVNGVKLVSVGLVAAIAYRYGWTRSDLNLRPGGLRAGTGLRLGGHELRWTVAGPLVIVAVLALFAAYLPAGALARLPHLAPWVPVFLLGALVNASAEEFLYRHVPLRALRPAMRVGPAVLLTSVLFGLGHLTGNPGGVVGVVYTTLFGLTCAAAMLRTRGFGWNLPIHVAGDLGVVISAALAG
ncbi:MAG: type II CAAX endopeptidase family protein [Actinocatenispora sp.]